MTNSGSFITRAFKTRYIQEVTLLNQTCTLRSSPWQSHCLGDARWKKLVEL